MANSASLKQRRRNEWIAQHGPCPCGSTDQLEVDHIDPSQKAISISDVWTRCAEVREAELAKCQVLCYKCHKAKTKCDLANNHHPHRNFEEEVVNAVRAAHRMGTSVASLARLHGTTWHTMNNLLTYKTYRRVQFEC